jgi:hypothetical protein
VRCTDGVERDVYEDPDGRQYMIGAQGEKVYGFWSVGSRRQTAAEVDDAALPESIVEEAHGDEPGGVRRDRDLHRGRLLSLLGAIAFGLGVIGSVSGVLGVPALGLSLYVRQAARRDLNRMKEGTMDPAGQEMTLAALHDANVGLVLSLIGVLVGVVAGVVLLFLLS